MPCFELSTYIFEPPVLRVPKSTSQQCHSYYGRDNAALAKSFGDWCTSVGVIGDATAHFESLLNHARKVYLRPKQDCLWLETRITHSSDEWVVPRPHHDGRYWDEKLNKGKEVLKVGACFVGPGTLFWDADEVATEAHWFANEGQEQRVRKEGLDRQSLEMRSWAADGLEKLGVRKMHPGLGQAVKWTVASEDKAAIHSEPDMSNMPDGRIFVSILPGTEAQMRQMCEVRNETFLEGP